MFQFRAVADVGRVRRSQRCRHVHEVPTGAAALPKTLVNGADDDHQVVREIGRLLAQSGARNNLIRPVVVVARHACTERKISLATPTRETDGMTLKCRLCLAVHILLM